MYALLVHNTNVVQNNTCWIKYNIDFLFYVSSHIRYSRYSRDLIIPENPNFISTSKMLYSISLAYDYNATLKVNKIYVIWYCSRRSQSNSFTKRLFSYIDVVDRVTL